MAHISRRQRNGKVTYLARYTDPSGRERAKSFTRKKDAERFLTLWRRATVELRPNTEARDERLFRLHILPRFGAMPLAAITQYEVRAWVTHTTRQGLAASSMRRAYQLLGKVMGAAVDAGMIAQNPCRRVPLPRIEPREMRFLTRPRLLGWPTAFDLPIGHWCCLVPMAAYESARWPGFAAAASTWTRGWSRSWRLSPRSAATSISGHPRPSGLPACRAPPGRGRGAGRAAGPSRVRRRPAAYGGGAVIAAGANPKEVAARAGHTSVSFTLDRYGHLYPDADTALRDRLDALHALSQTRPSARLDGPETD
jgi:Phage integrase, N-terminal SAM-like domain